MTQETRQIQGSQLRKGEHARPLVGAEDEAAPGWLVLRAWALLLAGLLHPSQLQPFQIGSFHLEI